MKLSPKLIAGLLFVFTLSVSLASCAVIGGIFKAGMAIGIIVVIIIIAIIAAIARMFRKG